MLQLSLVLSAHQNQVDALAAHYRSASVEGEWAFRNELGRGVLRHYPLPLGLAVYTYEYELGQPLHFDTLNPADSGLYCVFVNLGAGAMTKTVGHETVTLRKDSPGGVLFYSPDNHLTQPAQLPGTYRLVGLTFPREGLAALLPARVRADYFAPGQVFHVFEELSFDMEQQLRPLVAGSARPLDALTVYSRALGFLALLMQQVAQRAVAPATRLLRPDVERLFWVRAQLEARYQRPPTIAALAQETGLSASKLTRYFAQYFERTVGQYAQYVRLRRAQELLAGGRHSVSEAGYAVGYTNLTHFSRAFAKHFGRQPKTFLAAALRQVPVLG